MVNSHESEISHKVHSMNYRYNRCLRLLLIVVTWFICIYETCINFDKNSIFENVIHNVIIIIACIVSISVFLIELNKYKKLNHIKFFSGTITTIVCILCFFLVKHLLKKQDETPTILYAVERNKVLGSTSIDFRENGTFKLGVYHSLSSTYYRGRFAINDSVINLNYHSLPGNIVSHNLLLKEYPAEDSTKKERF